MNRRTLELSRSNSSISNYPLWVFVFFHLPPVDNHQFLVLGSLPFSPPETTWLVEQALILSLAPEFRELTDTIVEFSLYGFFCPQPIKAEILLLPGNTASQCR